ncbi:uncharacterized protein LOC125211434 isoform X2 [Salvia hispanica]|uniref:uncharacterized protein LOC125211434 isoform X2 n=1 Tax=Salvia hispanica TaxID=49212 RepID=UPI0020092280|nr:uncharacterized protein LOC125211434 isoform X2 [Salvia hispanica]
MPSVQPTLAPEIANNVIKLYRECLRRAHSFEPQNRELLIILVQSQFRHHKDETNPDKIQKYKDDAVRGVIDHMIFEAQRKAHQTQSTDES